MTLHGLKSSQLEGSLTEELKKQVSPYEQYRDLSEEELFTEASVDESNAERAGYSNYSYWGATLRCFFQDKAAVFFLVVIISVLLFTFIQPLLPNQKDPKTIYNDASGVQIINQQPNSEF